MTVDPAVWAASVVLADGEVIAEHPRHTRRRLLLEPQHYEGESTDRIEAPIPLGRMGRKLQELWDLAPERRAIAQYAAPAEVARRPLRARRRRMRRFRGSRHRWIWIARGSG